MHWIHAVLREPLLHFVVLGGALVLIFGGGEEDSAPDQIVISAGQVRNLAAVFERTWRRPPTRAELDGLIQDRVDERILAREARALGLDQDDTVIRRRLRQKMEFITQDLARPKPADDAELQAYLEAHPERFTTPGRISFAQVFLDRDRRGEDLEEDAERLLARLNAGGPVDPLALADPSLLDADHADVSMNDVARLFGAEFADRLETLPIGRWVGPAPSPYGDHLIRIDARSAPSLPPLDQVRPEVARELEAERRRATQEAFLSAMRDRYDVVVERPDAALVSAGQAVAVDR